MSSKPVSAAAAVHCCLLPATSCRRLMLLSLLLLTEQLTVSDQQLILLKLCMSVCARVSLVMEVKVNLIRCDISGGARE
jgi:hypothetical protein